MILRAETLDELHSRFFAGLLRKRAVNRLAQLAGAGYLHKADLVLFGEESPTRVYTLGPKARRELERLSLSSEHFLNRRWNPTLRDSSIPHQVFVNRVTRMIGGEVVPEHLLPVAGKDAARNRPDAAIHGIDREGRPALLAIEVDLGHYSRERIVAKSRAWNRLPDTGALIFVVPTEARARQVKRWLGSPYSRVFTPDELRAHVERVRRDAVSPLLFDLDIWAGGEGWAAIWEQRAEDERLDREEEEARQEVIRARVAANEAAAADAAARPATRGRGRSRG